MFDLLTSTSQAAVYGHPNFVEMTFSDAGPLTATFIFIHAACGGKMQIFNALNTKKNHCLTSLFY